MSSQDSIALEPETRAAALREPEPSAMNGQDPSPRREKRL